MVQNIIVIGGGQAAASLVAKIRQSDTESHITIVSEENAFPYQRPPLSKKYATGEMDAEQLLLRPAEWYEQNNVNCHLNTKVEQIDRENRRVVISDGNLLSYDKLAIVTGSRARRLPEDIGGNLEGVYVLRDLADADEFANEMQSERRVLIVGGGYIGLEAAAVCASKGLKVTLLEAAPRILQRVASSETSNWFRELHTQKGVIIKEGIGLEKLEADKGRVSAAILSDGSRIETDFVLVGIGIVPNMELAEAAGLEVAGGIKVNEYCQTSDADIYAAGDCAVFPYRDEMTRLESVQNAIDQAECAAENMLGEQKVYKPYPWFWSDQYDVKLQIAGLNRGFDNVVVRPGVREGTVSHWYFSNNQFIAVDAMNDPRSYMVGKKILETGKSVSPDQIADPGLELKSLL
ncbi:MAG: FAD-dependent oxidoreductase [Pseudomonadota bacterium]